MALGDSFESTAVYCIAVSQTATEWHQDYSHTLAPAVTINIIDSLDVYTGKAVMITEALPYLVC